MTSTNLLPHSAAIATNANALRDIKPPIDIPGGWEWLLWAFGFLYVAALIIAAVLVYLTLKRHAATSVAPPVPAHVRARQRLQEGLALIAEPKPFCTLVSNTIRFYLEERFNFRAPERTTEEFLCELRATELLLPDQKESLGEFLKRCDLVKFAGYEPREPELRNLHESAVRLVEETEPQPTTLSSNPEPGSRNPEPAAP